MKKQRILVIDDEQLITSTLKGILKRSGFETVITNSGGEAVSLIEHESFDLIISDIRMPGMDGIRTLHEIKTRLAGAGKTCPVIFITGFADEKLEAEAKAIGFEDYIYKPFDLKTFIDRINRILGEKIQSS
ncbi:MAG TPA: response regulator [Candidatus Omnitrophota bacterium]|nr:response regulator [Candidatus Omnitrophota bacterium]